MSIKTIWVVIAALFLGVAISLFLTGLWVLKITHNTLEYTESLKGRVDTEIQNTVERTIENEIQKELLKN